MHDKCETILFIIVLKSFFREFIVSSYSTFFWLQRYSLKKDCEKKVRFADRFDNIFETCMTVRWSANDLAYLRWRFNLYEVWSLLNVYDEWKCMWSFLHDIWCLTTLNIQETNHSSNFQLHDAEIPALQCPHSCWVTIRRQVQQNCSSQDRSYNRNFIVWCKFQVHNMQCM